MNVHSPLSSTAGIQDFFTRCLERNETAINLNPKRGCGVLPLYYANQRLEAAATLFL